jgi:hypothetical protein
MNDDGERYPMSATAADSGGGGGDGCNGAVKYRYKRQHRATASSRPQRFRLKYFNLTLNVSISNETGI